ncbi:hypothetical protein GQ600_8735 [Phytophthora cactorum]|nr:hypothetical protein GQ600_8735 [Phytophthora cactorum]
MLWIVGKKWFKLFADLKADKRVTKNHRESHAETYHDDACKKLNQLIGVVAIFAVLADTNSKVHHVASSKDTIRVMDPSSRNDEVDEEKEMFLPYILTDAMKTFCGRETTEARADPETGTSVDHKAAVVQDSAEAQGLHLSRWASALKILIDPAFLSFLNRQLSNWQQPNCYYALIMPTWIATTFRLCLIDANRG